ncbi:hypothetical protein O0544_04425 [Edwardsiella anguillarum]|nr:hypothetical protein [Edwardsiella anguillarum]
MLHARQRMNGGTHDFVTRFAFYMGNQAEAAVVPFMGCIVQHIQ